MERTEERLETSLVSKTVMQKHGSASMFKELSSESKEPNKKRGGCKR